MRRVLTGPAVLAAGVVLAASSTAAAYAAIPVPSTGGPSRTQVTSAVRHAEHSRYLWATVNVCVPHSGAGGVFGVRGQMPALPFRARLEMTFKLATYSTADKRFVPVTGATARRTVSLGSFSSRLHQSGVEFPYASNTGPLDATVTFSWVRAGRTLGSVSEVTTGGHPSAAYGRPPHHSAASCKL